MDRKTAWDAAIPLISAIIGGSAVALFGYLGTSRQMNVKMVEIAIGILEKQPSDPLRPAREWAVDVIDHNSNVRLSNLARASLLDNQLELAKALQEEQTVRAIEEINSSLDIFKKYVEEVGEMVGDTGPSSADTPSFQELQEEIERLQRELPATRENSN